MGCGASKAVGDKPPAADRAGATTSVKAIDAYNNLVPGQQCTVFLEAELKPTYDEGLTNANLQPASEPAQKYLLTLSGGEASQRVPTRIAGELQRLGFKYMRCVGGACSRGQRHRREWIEVHSRDSRAQDGNELSGRGQNVGKRGKRNDI